MGVTHRQDYKTYPHVLPAKLVRQLILQSRGIKYVYNLKQNADG